MPGELSINKCPAKLLVVTLTCCRHACLMDCVTQALADMLFADVLFYPGCTGCAVRNMGIVMMQAGAIFGSFRVDSAAHSTRRQPALLYARLPAHVHA